MGSCPRRSNEVEEEEFLSLKKGRKSLTEYLHKFNHLVRYASEDVPTDAAKQEKFMDGLFEELQDKLSTWTSLISRH